MCNSAPAGRLAATVVKSVIVGDIVRSTSKSRRNTLLLLKDVAMAYQLGLSYTTLMSAKPLIPVKDIWAVDVVSAE